jgi:hypothetical protein
VTQVVILFILFFSTSILSQDFQQDEINYKINQIDSNLYTYQKFEELILGQSTEGGSITAYFNNNDLKKINVIYYGETGRDEYDYYLEEDKLLAFIYSQYHYKEHIFLSDSVEIKQIEIFKYYFSNDTIISWTVQVPSRITVMSAMDILKDYYEHKSYIESFLKLTDTSYQVLLSEARIMNGDNLSEYVKHKPNFAKHYEIVEWECGLSCKNAAIIDLKSELVVGIINFCYELDYNIYSTTILVDSTQADDLCPIKVYELLEGKIIQVR